MTIDIKDFDGNRVPVTAPPPNGRVTAANSRPVALANEDLAVLAAQATSAKQDAQTAILTQLAGFLDGVEGLLGGTATQATLAALLAKVIAAPATEAKQDTLTAQMTSLLGYVDGLEALTGANTTALGSLATQTTLAAVLAKMIAAPATEAKQDALNALVTTQNTYLDGVEALITATNALLAAASAVVVNSPASIVSGQVAVTNASAVLVAARANRQTVVIVNNSTVAFYVGPAGVSAANGSLIPGVVGASLTISSAAAIHAVTAAGSAAATFLETF